MIDALVSGRRNMARVPVLDSKIRFLVKTGHLKLSEMRAVV